MLFWQILIDGFAISSLYALGATGFALIFGVSGVLNLSHGALMVAAVVAAWAAGNDLHVGPYAGAAIGVGIGLAALRCSLISSSSGRCRQSRKIREEEKEIFILTATLALGHHDPGVDRLFLHQQCEDRSADRPTASSPLSACARRRTRFSPPSSAGS